MTNEEPQSPAEKTFCLGCGYPLWNITSTCCPECGRSFDPADLQTVSIRSPLRQWQRWLLRPLGWPTIVFALLGTVGFVYLGGRPRISPEPWSVLYYEFRWPSADLRPLTKPDIIFYTTVSTWAAFLALSSLRQLARLLVPRNVRRGNTLRPLTARRDRFRRRLSAIAAGVSAAWLIFGWQHRIGQRWVIRQLGPSPNPSTMQLRLFGLDDLWCRPPVRLSPEQASLALSDAIVHLPVELDRMKLMKLLVETSGRDSLPGLVRIAATESSTPLLAWDLRLIGLCRVPSTEPFLVKFLNDARPEVRAATADAIGILRHPSYSLMPGRFWETGLQLGSDPVMEIAGIVSDPPGQVDSGWGGAGHDPENDAIITVDPSVRRRLDELMIDGTTVEEREAAARALVAWPPDKYRLRVAEWGVWVNNNGRMSMAKSVIDEIPPFVHGTGNRISSFRDYFLYPTIVGKPIVQFTSDVAMAIDVEVHIRDGRPWFAYPLPDDFALGTQYDGTGHYLGVVDGMRTNPPPNSPDEIDRPPIGSLEDCREGYPWLAPHHRIHSPAAGSNDNRSGRLYDLGLRWQSLIICPAQSTWMVPPVVPDDPRFRWWARLREVPCSWTASRGESERFLYYDGPTLLPVPESVELQNAERSLRFTVAARERSGEHRAEMFPRHPFDPLRASQPADTPEREGLYIEVDAGMVRGQHVAINKLTPVTLQSNLPFRGDAVVQQLRTMLISYGLTGAEADGLIAAWAPQFFQTDGRRFLLRMSAADYDWQCPMKVRPTPTELIRLGLVLTEFDAKPKVRPAESNAPGSR